MQMYFDLGNGKVILDLVNRVVGTDRNRMGWVSEINAVQ